MTIIQASFHVAWTGVAEIAGGEVPKNRDPLWAGGPQVWPCTGAVITLW